MQKTNLCHLFTILSWAANEMLKNLRKSELVCHYQGRDLWSTEIKWTHLSIVLVRTSLEIGPELNIQVQFVSDMQQKLSNQRRRKAAKDGLPVQQPLCAPGGWFLEKIQDTKSKTEFQVIPPFQWDNQTSDLPTPQSHCLMTSRTDVGRVAFPNLSSQPTDRGKSQLGGQC